MKKLQSKAATQGFTEIPEIVPITFTGGLESNRLLSEFKRCQELLNSQADLLDEWREETVQSLITPLFDQNDEAEGDEYTKSFEQQDRGKSRHRLVA